MRVTAALISAILFAVVITVSFARQGDDPSEQKIRLFYRADFNHPQTPDDYRDDVDVCATMHPDGSSYSERRIAFLQFYVNFFPECNPFNYWLSPDGRRWLWERQDEYGVYDLTGRALGTIQAEGPANRAKYVTWSPDSRHVLYWDEANSRLLELGESGATRELAAFAAADFPPLQVKNGDGQLTLPVSPDGSVVLVAAKPAVNTDANDLYAVRLDGSGATNLTNSLDDEIVSRNFSVSWSADGRRIAYDRTSVRMATVTVRSANARTGPGQNYPVVFTFQQGAEFVVNARQNGWAQTVADDGQVVWISDTLLQIADGGYETLVMNADGSDSVVVGTGIYPTFSPDGSQIAFACFTRTRRWSLCLATATGEDVRQVVDDDFLSVAPLGWSPDSRYIAYFTPIGEPQGELHIYDAETEQDSVGLTFELSFIEYNSAQWSEDSEHLLFYFELPDPQGRPGYAGNSDYYICTPIDCQPLPHMPDPGVAESILAAAWWEPVR